MARGEKGRVNRRSRTSRPANRTRTHIHTHQRAHLSAHAAAAAADEPRATLGLCVLLRPVSRAANARQTFGRSLVVSPYANLNRVRFVVVVVDFRARRIRIEFFFPPRNRTVSLSHFRRTNRETSLSRPPSVRCACVRVCAYTRVCTCVCACVRVSFEF